MYCDAAVVARANLMQSLEQRLIIVKAGVLLPDANMCHIFGDATKGYGLQSSLYLKDSVILYGIGIRLGPSSESNSSEWGWYSLSLFDKGSSRYHWKV